MKRAFSAVLVSCALCLALVACDEEEAEETESTEPIVGVMELPISLRHAEAPNNAVQIEVSPTKMRVDAHTILDLDNGRVADAERAGDTITKLSAAIAGGSARRVAALRLHANTPYMTTALIMGTLKQANIHEVGIAVRRGTGTDVGWLMLGNIDVRDEDQHEWATFPGTHQRRWDEIGQHWEAMTEACTASEHKVDCAYKPASIAEGGDMQINLFARGNAVKVEMHRFGVEDAGTPAGGGGPEMIEGVPSLDTPVEELPPATEAAFTWRFQATTTDPSPVSLTMRELCGATPCGVMVTAEGQTPTMRIASFLGAVFPNGAPAPHVLFQLPEQ